MIAVVFVALWLPITQHCKLETIPGLEFLRCASDTPSNSDCNGDECQSVESGAYKVEDNQTILPLLVSAAVLREVLSVIDMPGVAGAGRVTITVAPPELPKTWQFSFRTALPVRAPSRAS